MSDTTLIPVDDTAELIRRDERIPWHTSRGGSAVQLETMYSEVNDSVATLVLNRPQVLNCANEQWARDLNTLVDDLSTNSQIRVVVLRGAGRAFSAGADLRAHRETGEGKATSEGRKGRRASCPRRYRRLEPAPNGC